MIPPEFITIQMEREDRTMENEKRLMINEGMIILSWAYALSGFHTAAAVFGLGGGIFAILGTSKRSLLNNLPRILFWTVIRLPMLASADLTQQFGAVVLPAFCSTIVSLLAQEYSAEELEPTVRILAASFPVFLFAALYMGEGAELFLFGTNYSTLSLVLAVCEIFLPFLSAFLAKEIGLASFLKLADYNDSYDRMAHTAVRKEPE